jgi:hypothetical protein
VLGALQGSASACFMQNANSVTSRSTDFKTAYSFIKYHNTVTPVPLKPFTRNGLLNNSLGLIKVRNSINYIKLTQLRTTFMKISYYL